MKYVYVFIPTGYGTSGIDKESLNVVINMLTEMSSSPVHKSFGTVRGNMFNHVWGCIVSAYISDYSESILRDLNFKLLNIRYNTYNEDEPISHIVDHLTPITI